MASVFPDSELIINEDGSAFHLHLKPGQLADRVILVGDPGRVDTFASYFDEIQCRVSNREFHTATGLYRGKRISVISSGIGTDNIDIVLNELDTLVNIDYDTREEKPLHQTLTLVRVGTCGSLQEDLPVGTFLISEKSVGTDGMLNFYARRNEVSDLDFESEFCRQTGYSDLWARPYVVNSDASLIAQFTEGRDDIKKGVTVTCNGFYGPQGRQLRGELAHPGFNKALRDFRYHQWRITNFEMESAGIEGMAALLGHRAMTICLVVANRYSKAMFTDYYGRMDDLVRLVLEKI